LLGATVVAIRLAWMYPVPYVTARLDRRVDGSEPVTDPRKRLLLGISGMRGAVSVAAALAIPASAAARDELLLLTCGTVLVTIVPSALALPALVRRLGLCQTDEARRRCVDAREAYDLKIARLEREVDSADASHGDLADTYRRVRRQLIEAEQQALDELRDAKEVSGEPLRRIQRELDLEATRLEG
jgi:monovalent cation/hydrogen antiporter